MENDHRPGPGGNFIRGASGVLPDYLSKNALDRCDLAAFAEDLGTVENSPAEDLSKINFRSGDVTTSRTVPALAAGRARLIAKQNGVLAGTMVATRVFQLLDEHLQIDWLIEDGDSVGQDDLLARIDGPLSSILTAERTMLNFLQRMSGIATSTRAFAAELENSGTRILDTRKTAPGLRLLDKWAVKIGGGVNHRLGLYDEIMIKDNHIAASGGLSHALQMVIDRQTTASKTPESDRNRHVNVVVEVTSLDQIREILRVGGVDRILLDNMVDLHDDSDPDVSRLQEAVELIEGKILTEASGNVTLATVRVIADTGVDFVSVGALTHSVSALDLSLLIEPVKSA